LNVNYNKQKESNMAGKRKEGLVEPYITPEKGDSGSQSPQARRGSAQDFEKFGDRTVTDGISWKEDATGSAAAYKRASDLSIEDQNPAK
jgi:hypothetical protein